MNHEFNNVSAIKSTKNFFGDQQSSIFPDNSPWINEEYLY